MASDPWAAGMRVLFASAGSAAAVYTPAGADPFPLRVILESPDRLERMGDGQIILATHVVSLMKQDVPAPAEGDRLTVAREGGDLLLSLVGEPLGDAENLSWKIGAEPVEG